MATPDHTSVGMSNAVTNSLWKVLPYQSYSLDLPKVFEPHKICHKAATATGHISLLSLCRSSINIAATTVIYFLATVLSNLFSSFNIWKVFFLTSCKPGNIALTDGSLHGATKMRCYRLEINSDEATFRI
jgi:hypothetical protein